MIKIKFITHLLLFILYYSYITFYLPSSSISIGSGLAGLLSRSGSISPGLNLLISSEV